MLSKDAAGQFVICGVPGGSGDVPGGSGSGDAAPASPSGGAPASPVGPSVGLQEVIGGDLPSGGSGSGAAAPASPSGNYDFDSFLSVLVGDNDIQDTLQHGPEGGSSALWTGSPLPSPDSIANTMPGEELQIDHDAGEGGSGDGEPDADLQSAQYLSGGGNNDDEGLRSYFLGAASPVPPAVIGASVLALEPATEPVLIDGQIICEDDAEFINEVAQEHTETQRQLNAALRQNAILTGVLRKVKPLVEKGFMLNQIMNIGSYTPAHAHGSEISRRVFGAAQAPLQAHSIPASAPWQGGAERPTSASGVTIQGPPIPLDLSKP